MLLKLFVVKDKFLKFPVVHGLLSCVLCQASICRATCDSGPKLSKSQVNLNPDEAEKASGHTLGCQITAQVSGCLLSAICPFLLINWKPLADQLSANHSLSSMLIDYFLLDFKVQTFFLSIL